MSTDSQTCVYGAPPASLADTPEGAVQVSPTVAGSSRLEDLAPQSLTEAVIAAPPGAAERRYVLALTLRALAAGAHLTAMAPKDRGGSRLRKELEGFGCLVEDTGRQHQRICRAERPAAPTGLDEAIAAGGPQKAPALDLWTQPGLFSWDRPDPGSQLLISALPALTGHGADLGCGAGLLAQAILTRTGVTQLELVDIDRRAIDAAKRNIHDPRAKLHWTDARTAPELEGLNFVVMNPPFHDGGHEDRRLGQAFIARAHQILKKGGALWVVANRHLPYEAVLSDNFSHVDLKAEAKGFKVYEARK